MFEIILVVVAIGGWFGVAQWAEKWDWVNKERGGFRFLKLLALNCVYNVAFMVIVGIGFALWGSHASGAI